MSNDYLALSEFTKEDLAIVLRFLQNELQGIQIVLNDNKKFRLTSLTALDVLVDLRDIVRDTLDEKEN